MTQRYSVLLDHLQAVLAQRAWLSQQSPAPAPASRDLPAAQVGLSQEYRHRPSVSLFLAFPFRQRLRCLELGMRVLAYRGLATPPIPGLLKLRAAPACAAANTEAMPPVPSMRLSIRLSICLSICLDTCLGAFKTFGAQ